MGRQFSQEFKNSVVQKALLPNAPTIKSISRDLGIHPVTISRWIKKCGTESFMSKKDQKRPQLWPAEKKFQAIIETSSMNEEEFGAYLRKHGLHSSDIENWRAECMAAFKSKGRPKKDPELVKLERECKELKKDSRRKDRALAEMSARLVLQKKSQLIWGDREDDE